MSLPKCAICCMDMRKEDCVIAPCCQELFHKQCVFEWIQQHPNSLCFVCAKRRLVDISDFIPYERIVNKLILVPDKKTHEQEVQDFIENLAKKTQSLSVAAFKNEFSSALGKPPTLTEINEFLKLDALYHPPPPEQNRFHIDFFPSLHSPVHFSLPSFDQIISSHSSEPITSHASEQEGSDLDEDDINIVMTEAGVSKDVAVAALRANEKDYIKAIMSIASNSKKDFSDLNEEDVSIVMTEAGVSKEVAMAALRANEKDYIKAIMSLDSGEVSGSASAHFRPHSASAKEVSLSGLDQDIVDIVALETGVSKAKAAAALLANDKDYARAITAISLDVD